MRIIGSKIKEARKLKGLTQEDLAEMSKINLRTIQRIENNENIPRGNTLNMVCEVLDIKIEDIIEQTNDSDKSTLILKSINILFIVIINILIITIFGFLTIDLNSNMNSKVAAIVLSFFLTFFIVYKTQKISKLNRLLKFGIGLFFYTILISTKVSFPSLLMTGLLPSLLIVLGTLFYGDELLNKK